MKALIVNAVGGSFDFEDVQIAEPTGREVLVDVQASGLCHTDLLFRRESYIPDTGRVWPRDRRGCGGSWP
jgi:S-(hydroxymethyl)glutathione dehydrogenase/alcohol dehydrogenase